MGASFLRTWIAEPSLVSPRSTPLIAWLGCPGWTPDAGNVSIGITDIGTYSALGCDTCFRLRPVMH